MKIMFVEINQSKLAYIALSLMSILTAFLIAFSPFFGRALILAMSNEDLPFVDYALIGTIAVNALLVVCMCLSWYFLGQGKVKRSLLSISVPFSLWCTVLLVFWLVAMFV